MQYTSTTPWRSSHRARLARLASDQLENVVEVVPPPRTIAIALAALEANSNDGGDGGRSDEAEEEREGADRRRSRVRRNQHQEERRAKTFGSKVDLSMEDVLLGIPQGLLNERLLDVGLAYEAIREFHLSFRFFPLHSSDDVTYLSFLVHFLSSECDQADGTCSLLLFHFFPNLRILSERLFSSN